MVDPKRLLSPEVEELLAEAAANPRSMLMRSPRAAELREPFDLEAGVSARAAGLSAPERKILEVYREETAELLRQWIGLALVDPARGSRFLSRSDSSGNPVGSIDSRHLNTRASALLRSRSLQRMPQIQHGLDSMLKEGVPQLAATESLAKLLLEIRPSDSTRILLALSQAVTGSSRNAKRILKSILRTSVSRSTSAYALHNLAWLSKGDGDDGVALRAYAAAVEAAPLWGLPLTGLLLTSVEMGAEASAFHAAERLDELGPIAAESSRIQSANYQSEARISGWAPSPTAKNLATRLCSQFGAGTRRILDVFQ